MNRVIVAIATCIHYPAVPARRTKAVCLYFLMQYTLCVIHTLNTLDVVLISVNETRVCIITGYTLVMVMILNYWNVPHTINMYIWINGVISITHFGIVYHAVECTVSVLECSFRTWILVRPMPMNSLFSVYANVNYTILITSVYVRFK